MNVVLANPRGFCAGVDRAIAIVERALTQFGAPIYVRHQVVHNKFVVKSLSDKGAVFVEELSEVPKGSTVVFSAHGVSKNVRKEADKFGLKVFDATCPLVTKVHTEVMRYRKEGRTVFLIGHAGHPEVEGTLGQVKDGVILVETLQEVENLKIKDESMLAHVSQTTLSVDDTIGIIDALKARFPQMIGPRKNDICYATQNRQDAVKRLAKNCDVVLVVGSTNSSNSNRLKELAQQFGVDAYLIDGADEIQESWLSGKRSIGLTAGASAPEVLVEQVVERLKEYEGEVIKMDAPDEGVSFALPAGLQ
ncbi:MAG: 4-hydroxy-3-methylbut-2-enyl diphosphate reductase [Arenicellales bacterium]